MAGRPNKYDTHIKPYLEQIKQWKRQGVTDAQICKELNVSVSVFCDAKNKYSEFSEVLKESTARFCADLRGEMARLAFKHELKTTKIYTTTEADGSTKTHKEVTVKEVDGNVTAQHLLLKNMDRENWADNPQDLALKKEQNELKRLLAEANNFDLSLADFDK